MLQLFNSALKVQSCRFLYKGNYDAFSKELNTFFNLNEWGTETRLSGHSIDAVSFSVYPYVRIRRYLEPTKIMGTITFSGKKNLEIKATVIPSAKMKTRLFLLCFFFGLMILSILISPEYLVVKMMILLGLTLAIFILLQVIKEDKKSLVSRFKSRFLLENLESTDSFELLV